MAISFRDIEIRNAAGGEVAEHRGVVWLPALIVSSTNEGAGDNQTRAPAADGPAQIRTDLLGTTDGTAVGIGMLRRDVQDVRLKWV